MINNYYINFKYKKFNLNKSLKTYNMYSFIKKLLSDRIINLITVSSINLFVHISQEYI